jgi:hypothetical protein
MTRPILAFPQNNQEWDNLPAAFTEFMNKVDLIRQSKANLQIIDPLYPSYDYDWDIDSTIPLETLIYYWNQTDKPLPDPEEVVEEINEGLGEAAFEAHEVSRYWG